MSEQKDTIAEGIKSGEIYAMKCEELKNSPCNLKYCTDREECETLQEHIVSIDEMEQIILDLYCGFCESDSWLFTGITKDGVMITATTSKEYAEELNTLIDNARKKK